MRGERRISSRNVRRNSMTANGFAFTDDDLYRTLTAAQARQLPTLS